MNEDIKLMAEFMGIGLITSTFIDEGVMVRVMVTVDDREIPDYPKDMNALLGVMDKIKDEHSVYVRIMPRSKWYFVSFHDPKQRSMYSVDQFVNWVDLPSVLFPLLVEAIKHIKESK